MIRAAYAAYAAYARKNERAYAAYAAYAHVRMVPHAWRARARTIHTCAHMNGAHMRAPYARART